MNEQTNFAFSTCITYCQCSSSCGVIIRVSVVLKRTVGDSD